MLQEKEQVETAIKDVTQQEAAKHIITKSDKIIVFTGLLLVSWVISWEKGIVYAITPTVTSHFGANNISGVLATVLDILQVALQPIYSKLSDMTGRATAYTISLMFFLISFIVMACANDYNTLIGGQVIYAFGYSGIYVLGPTLIGDMTSLASRTLVLAIYNFPLIINQFTAGAAAQSLLNNNQWRWGYGHISIVLFATGLPIVAVLFKMQGKANKTFSVLQDESIGDIRDSPKIEGPLHKRLKSIIKRILRLAHEIDLIGSILLIAGLFLVLLPLILAPSWGGWERSTVIATLTSGGAIWLLFLVWEWKCTNKPILPLTNWESKNPIWGTLAMFMIWTINNMMNLQYFLNYLQVTRRASLQIATYLERGFNCANIVLAIPMGYLIQRTRRWIPFVRIGACLTVLGSGLMIPARQSTSSDVFIVFSQIILGAGCALMNYPILVGIQGSVPRKDIAIVVAMFEVGIAVAGSVGSTIAGAIWNSILPGLLNKNVPGDFSYPYITSSIKHALSLPEEQYKDVVVAYDEAMHILSIAAACVGAVSFICSLLLKGGLLEDYTDRKGTSDIISISDENGNKELGNKVAHF